jgi:hypothetical protein
MCVVHSSRLRQPRTYSMRKPTTASPATPYPVIFIQSWRSVRIFTASSSAGGDATTRHHDASESKNGARNEPEPVRCSERAHLRSRSGVIERGAVGCGHGDVSRVPEMAAANQVCLPHSSGTLLVQSWVHPRAFASENSSSLAIDTTSKLRAPGVSVLNRCASATVAKAIGPVGSDSSSPHSHMRASRRRS